MITGKLKITEREYRQLDKLSSSDLRLFSTDRRRFFKTVVMKQEDEEEEYSKSLLVGDLVHTMMLEPDLFDSKYIMSICSSPPTGLMLAFTEALYKYTKLAMAEDGTVTRDFRDLAEDAYKESGFKITLDAVLKKFVGSEAENYYKEIRLARTNNKTVVCLEDASIAEKIAENLETHPFTREIFYHDEGCDNEVKLEDFEIDGLPMKAMIDRYTSSFADQTIQPYDLKIVWDNQSFYREYYLKRRADIQGYVYHQALVQNLSKINPSFRGYKVLPPIFVVADSSNFYAPILYQMTEKDLMDAYNGFDINGRKYPGVKEIIDEIRWAQETSTWTYSKKDSETNGVRTLNP